MRDQTTTAAYGPEPEPFRSASPPGTARLHGPTATPEALRSSPEGTEGLHRCKALRGVPEGTEWLLHHRLWECRLGHPVGLRHLVGRTERLRSRLRNH